MSVVLFLEYMFPVCVVHLQRLECSILLPTVIWIRSAEMDFHGEICTPVTKKSSVSKGDAHLRFETLYHCLLVSEIMLFGSAL